MSHTKLEVVKGKEILRYLNELSHLRMAFYREYPYLYSASKEAEAKYFQMFAASEESRAVVAKEGNKVVGAIIGMPLSEMKEKFREPYNKKGKQVDSIYYLADILVKAGVPLRGDIKGVDVSKYVAGIGVDAFFALFSLPEFDNGNFLVADSVNNAPLLADAAPLELISPNEMRRNRWVKKLNFIRVGKI